MSAVKAREPSVPGMPPCRLVAMTAVRILILIVVVALNGCQQSAVTSSGPPTAGGASSALTTLTPVPASTPAAPTPTVSSSTWAPPPRTKTSGCRSQGGLPDPALIPLELGGAPQDVANLWVEPWNGNANAHMKDAVETYLNREVCRGAMPLADAQLPEQRAVPGVCCPG